MFEAQTYADRELVVVQNADEIPAPVPGGIVSVIVPAGTFLGAKLNLGIAAAHGDVFHKWDDDDLYAPGFLARGIADIPLADLALWTNCLVQFPDGTRQLRGFRAGGSMLFARRLWEKTPFRDVPRAVDSWLLSDAVTSNFKVSEVVNSPELYTYVRHGGNMWLNMQDGKSVDDVLRQRATRWPAFNGDVTINGTLNPAEIRIPMIRGPIGLGDVIKAATGALGIKPCAPCEQRAARLNTKLTFVPR